MTRIDEELVSRGLAASRSQARLLVRERRVLNDQTGTPFDKPSRAVSPATPLRIIDPPRFVSRGGDKLDALITAFDLQVEGCIALDAGASTGGFVDCLLQHGAKRVIAIDVGHGQLHPSLINHPRVHSIEGLNVRDLQADPLPEPAYHCMTADLSFISLTKVLESLWVHLHSGGWLGVLIKPQFELDATALKRCRGVVRDPALQQQALTQILTFASEHLNHCQLIGHIVSPVIGGDGNREFLAAWRKA